MARVLLISSYVACGTVGLQATAPPLRHAGFDVIAVPTTLLSNHPGHAHVAGTAVEPAVMAGMIDAIAANGWLAGVGAIISGYLPSTGHVAVMQNTVDRVRSVSPDALYVCDPVLGDDPKGLYIDPAAAEAVRDMLVPAASIITPNRFELEWLSGRDVHDLNSAAEAARSLGPMITAATSIPAGNDAIANVLITHDTFQQARVERRARVPHGTGDVFTGLFAASLLDGNSAAAALTVATAALARVIAASGASGALNLSEFYASPAASLRPV